MAKARRKQAKKTKSPAPKRRRERRFLPLPTQASRASVGVGMAGAGVLGAGVWGQWISDQPPEYAPYLVAAGAVALAGALWFGDLGAGPVRVGDAGVALEKGPELVRVLWCDMQRVRVEKRNLVIRSVENTLNVPLGAHSAAVAWILAEGQKRVPDVMDVRRNVVDSLPEPRERDGTLVSIEAYQVAGRQCAASEMVISFERDARLCPNCGQAYHKAHVPPECVTCEQPLGTNVMSV